MRSNPQKPQTGVNILLVEDDAHTLMALARLLRKYGHLVHTADGYQAALEVARREPIDLAICDIVLWDGDGSDLLGELQKVQHLKAIAVTGFALADEVEHYTEAGFLAVIPKPIDISKLRLTISQLVSKAPEAAFFCDHRGSQSFPRSGNA
jgi:DNA-binding NtrC family response regulator